MKDGAASARLPEGKCVIKFSEIENKSNIAIKSLVALYRDKLEEDALKQVEGVDISPRMDVEQVRAARLGIFEKP